MSTVEALIPVIIGGIIIIAAIKFSGKRIFIVAFVIGFILFMLNRMGIIG